MKWAWVLALVGVLVLSAKRALGYVRGQPVPLDLVSIGGGHYLAAGPAAAFTAMAAAARAAGVELQINDAFRSMEAQRSLWDAFQRGERTAAVSAPGWSLHQSGRAVDLESAGGTNAAYRWLVANAARWGWRRTVPSEPWHWEHQ